MVRWEAAALGWVTLNTDGASSRNEMTIAGCGGLCSAGMKVDGGCVVFPKDWAASCSAFIAELWGVLEGLQLARSRGLFVCGASS